jgi:hypothetical protein
MNNRRRQTGSFVMLTMVASLGYGVLRFPDSPIRPCVEHGYCGKLGQPRTREDFVSFSRWQTAIFVVMPLGLLSLYLLDRKSK